MELTAVIGSVWKEVLQCPVEYSQYFPDLTVIYLTWYIPELSLFTIFLYVMVWQVINK